MPSYQFENRAGERRTIVATMKDSPPEVLRFDGKRHIACERDHQDAFIRVYETAHAYARNWSAWRSPMTGGKIMDL